MQRKEVGCVQRGKPRRTEFFCCGQSAQFDGWDRTFYFFNRLMRLRIYSPFLCFPGLARHSFGPANKFAAPSKDSTPLAQNEDYRTLIIDICIKFFLIFIIFDTCIKYLQLKSLAFELSSIKLIECLAGDRSLQMLNLRKIRREACN